MRKGEVLHRVKEKGNVLYIINRRKANWVSILHSVRFQPTDAHNCH